MPSQQRKLRPGIAGAVVLAIFVNAGSLKSHPLAAWIPVDLTLLLAILLALLAVGAMIRHSHLPPAFWLPIGFALATVPGVLGNSSAYGTDKALYFYTLTLLGMIAGTLLLREYRQRAAFLTTLTVIGVAVAILVTVAPDRPAEWSAVVTLPGTNTIGTSRMILAGVIALVLHAVIGHRKPIVRLLMLVLAVFMTLTAVSTGSRGPFLATGAALIVALLLTPAFGRRRLRSVTLVLAAAGAGVYLASQNAVGGLTRILSFVGGDADASAGARGDFWLLSLQYIPQLPFGGGWGYFGSIIGSNGLVDVSTSYPHNSIIEITLEAGWLAGIAFVILGTIAFFRYMRASATAMSVTFFVLFVFAFANSLVSGEVNDNRLMWVLLAVAFVIPRHNTETPRLPADAEKRGVMNRHPVRM